MTTPTWLLSLADKLKRQAADLVAEHDLPGAVVGLVNGADPENALAWCGALGWGGGPSQALDADTLFRVASITKTFTATAIVQLRDQGKLRLDDPLVQHVPEFAAATNPFGPIEDVTLRRIASHSSGLVGEPPLDHWATLRFPTREEWLASLPGVRIAIPPGSAFKYSNLGYTLLGEVVERVSGQPYVEYMQESVFGPLGMASSTYEPTGDLASRAAPGHMAHPFEDSAGPALPSPLNGMAAAGQLWTTARDLSRWIAAHCLADGSAAVVAAASEARQGPGSGGPRSGGAVGGLPLSPASLYEMQQAIYAEPGWVGGYGFGWRINRRGDRVYHGHGGSVPGYRSQIFFDASLKIGIVLLIDGVGMADAIAAPLMDTAAAHVAAAEQSRPSALPAQTPPEYRRFLGLYQMLRVGDTSTRIEYRNGMLTLKDSVTGPFPGGPPVTLDPTDEPTVFMVRGGRYSGEALAFRLSDDGLVTGFTASGFHFVRLGERA